MFEIPYFHPRRCTAQQLARMEQNIMAVLDDLRAAVQKNTSVSQSAVTLINGLAAKVGSLTAASGDGSISADDAQSLIAELNSSADALAADVTANTPADPAAANNASAGQVGGAAAGSTGV